MEVEVRWMHRSDMDQVLEIERLCFGQDAWSEQDFVRRLAERSMVPMVAMPDGNACVVGFLLFSMEDVRYRMVSIAVHNEFRHSGVGTAMIDRLASRMKPDRRTSIVADIADDNLDAQLFMKANGFRAVKVERLAAGGRDAYVMERRLA